MEIIIYISLNVPDVLSKSFDGISMSYFEYVFYNLIDDVAP